MDQRLTEKHHGSSLALQSLNTKAQQLVCSKQSVYCVWDVRWKENMPVCLQCVFSASFSSASEEVSSFKPYHYEFQLERVTTLYSVRAEIMPAAGQQNCHSGSLCGLEMSITRLAEPEDDEDDDGGTEEKGRQRQRRSAPPSSCMKWQTAAVAGWCMAEAQGWCPCQRMLMPTTGYRLS
ncbi:trafficking protein particle complex subunit 10-like isoform X1 [Oncorhynchus masou masou]|uniref:trafficking protein particle complex subunit 10-like isoform X1 n=1 Tax=Oncorhynchus masou masou TaxID=90313 RepID=UPI0031837441